jgi:hypothetical protein
MLALDFKNSLLYELEYVRQTYNEHLAIMKIYDIHGCKYKIWVGKGFTFG